MSWRRSRVPARQLNSVAGRYRSPWHERHPLRPWTWGDRPAAPTADAKTKTTRDPKMQRLEAVFFLAREPLSSRKLSDYANLADGTEARTLIRRLNEQYDASGRAFRIEEVGGGFQLLSRPKFAAWLRRLGHVPAETRLSAPVLETLAVIAYRQPVLRADIEAIRGVNCGEILRQLMERDLVRISGRSPELGRPYLYSTTKRFLQLVGLPNIDKLPRVETMRSIAGVANPVDSAQRASNANGPQNSWNPSQLSPPHKEESEVTVTTREFAHDECYDDEALVPPIAIAAEPRDADDDDFEEEEVEEDDEEFEDEDEDADEEEEFDEEEEEEFDDEDEDFEELEEEDDIEEEDEADDDFEDDEWEEVEDDEEEEDWDDEEMDWGDEEDEDDEEEEEEEGEEEWD